MSIVLSFKCECGLYNEYDRKEALFRDIVDTFLRERVRGATCGGCGKIRRADVYIRTADSIEELCFVEYNIKTNKWLERDIEGNIYEGQPPILSIELAYDVVGNVGLAVQKTRKIRETRLRNMALARSQRREYVTPKRRKPPGKVYLKPWKDPESLFCSPKLTEIVGKKLSTGDECRDGA